MPVDADFLMQRLMAGGMSQMQAAAVVGNLQRESSLNPAAVNKDEGAYGLMQWRGPRFTNLQQFAAQQGKPWTDPGVQADFIGHELRTTERGNASDFNKAPDIDAATKAFGNQVVRFGDKSLSERQGNARALYGGADRQAGGPALPDDAARATAAPASRDDIAQRLYQQQLMNAPNPRGIRGGLQSVGRSLAMAINPRSPVAMTQSSGADVPTRPTGGGAAAGGQTLSTPQLPPAFPGGTPPLPASRPATAPGPLTPGPDAASALPGARMGALADLAAYQDGGWYG